MSYDTAQMDRLEAYLKKNGYNYTRGRRWPEGMEERLAQTNPGEDAGEQIIVYRDGAKQTQKNRLWDVICGYGSYGYKDGLLEIMEEPCLKNGKEIHPGILVPEEVRNGEKHAVDGELTADDIIGRLEKSRERDVNIEEDDIER